MGVCGWGFYRNGAEARRGLRQCWLAGRRAGASLQLRPVRMTFKTDYPSSPIKTYRFFIERKNITPLQG